MCSLLEKNSDLKWFASTNPNFSSPVDKMIHSVLGKEKKLLVYNRKVREKRSNVPLEDRTAANTAVCLCAPHKWKGVATLRLRWRFPLTKRMKICEISFLSVNLQCTRHYEYMEKNSSTILIFMRTYVEP